MKGFSNSQNAVRIIHDGNPVTELQSIAVTIFQLYLYGGSVDSKRPKYQGGLP